MQERSKFKCQDKLNTVAIKNFNDIYSPVVLYRKTNNGKKVMAQNYVFSLQQKKVSFNLKVKNDGSKTHIEGWV